MADASTAIDRIPVAHSVVYAVRGAPDIADEYCAARTIAPTEITLTYRSTEDSQLGRVHAYVKGWWMEDGKRVPMDKPVGRHLYGDPDAWPTWLAEEARLHDPAVEAQLQSTREVEEHRLALSEALHLGNGAPWDAILDRAGELSRRDVEAQQEPETETRTVRWRLQILDGVWGSYGRPFNDRDEATARLCSDNEQRPVWNDPDRTPVLRRLVRETTTYTVEAASEAQQDGEQS